MSADMPKTQYHLIVGLAMIIAAGLALALTPREKIADQRPKIDLETMIPKQFGEWKVDESLVPLQVSPDVKAKLDHIYNQTLSRTYINTQGDRIMLSIAYGGDQSDSMQVHKPEVCYPSQGFQVIKQSKAILETGFHPVPVVRLAAAQNNRVEPITYWIIIGDKVPASGTGRKIEQLKYGLTGKVPDGLLFRVSSISMDQNQAFTEQAGFINELLKGVSPQVRARLIGQSS
jgi:EpsI family protein